MNFPPPYPNPHLAISPSFNPNPNAGPNFHPSVPPSPLQVFDSLLCQTQNPPADLPTSLSLINNLLDLSLSTLRSLSSLLPTTTSQQPRSLFSDGFSRCPFNPPHLMPPESLFLHTLRCPTPLEGARSLIDSLRYTKTLKAQHQLIQENNFVQSLGDPQAELCFSLDDYVDSGLNFFYEDCPGVVRSVSYDGSKRMFSLPGVLSVECANFTYVSDRRIGWDEISCLKLFPSELWYVKCETEKWHDFPDAYSYNVLRILVWLERVKECDLPMWVIANSPRFGVVIDVPMREHVFVLFRVCLKAIVREANRSYELLLKGDSTGTNGCHLNPKTLSFECPVLVKAFTWLTLQLSVLYGEANAKSFAIGMLKHLLLNIASSSLVYPPRRGVDGASSSEQTSTSLSAKFASDVSLGKLVDSDGDDNKYEQGIFSGAIFVYQVAAAIAALHERLSLEEKIKALRHPQPLPAYQRMAEHAYLSKIAEDERHKRSNYRPPVQHEGILMQHSRDLVTTNRFKTKEELLAEERDYKRRRMSYRGKKLKRTPKEVMRDIIEEHMEAISRAGGIGCFAQGIEERAVFAPEGSSALERSGSMNSNRGIPNEHVSNKDQRQSYRKHMHSDYSDMISMDVKSRRYDRWMGDCHNPDLNDRDQREESRDRHRGDSYSRSLGRDRSHGWSRNKSDRWKDGIGELTEGKCYKSNHTTKCHGIRSPSPTICSVGVSSRRKDARSSGDSVRHRCERSRNDRSSSTTQRGFGDRYDRYRSPDMGEG